MDEKFMLALQVFSNKVGKYIHDIIPPIRYSFRHPDPSTAFPCRTAYSKSSFCCES